MSHKQQSNTALLVNHTQTTQYNQKTKNNMRSLTS